MKCCYAEDHELTNPETPNKAVFARGGFKVYVPLTELPEAVPDSARVELFFPWDPEDDEPEDGSERTISEVVQKNPPERQAKHTVVYAPIGDPKSWGIGEPYIPNEILGEPAPEYVLVRVSF